MPKDFRISISRQTTTGIAHSVSIGPYTKPVDIRPDPRIFAKNLRTGASAT